MHRINELFSWQTQDSLVFNRLDFWLFFLAVMMVFVVIHQRFVLRSIFLTGVSLFFYFKTSGNFVLLLAAMLAINYLLGLGVQHKEGTKFNRMWLIVGLVLNLLGLFYFKYAYFFTDAFNAQFGTDYNVVNQFAVLGNQWFGKGSFVDKILVPVGVSFFTFHNISYLVDIFRKEINASKNFFDYAFYVTYFPHLILGPIVRARDFIPQIYKPFELNKLEFSRALWMIGKGLFKKLILADYIAVHFIDKVLDAPESYPGFVGVLAMFGYSLQIYADFSGYTDMAIGVSRLMGFSLLENFNSPYKSVSVADFWRRWHKSLGAWLRDYLYIPLGGNKKGSLGTVIMTVVILGFLFFITGWVELWYIYSGLLLVYLLLWQLWPAFKTFAVRDLNLLITMIVGGLWHGASQNFVIWGAMNGAALVLYNYWRRLSPYENNPTWLIRAWRIFFTLSFITFTRIWFRLPSPEQPFAYLSHVYSHFDWSLTVWWKVWYNFQTVFWLILLGFVTHWLPQKWKDQTVMVFAKCPLPLQALIFAFSVFIMYQAVSETFKAFVYFQF
ncbi:MAG: MBOAT family protein [Bacteroidetes bacterium]|nr:MBOAT family protein [Bacteroidota bacterium]